MNNNNPVNTTNNDTDIWGRKINDNSELTIHKSTQDNHENAVEKLDTPKIVGNIGNSESTNNEVKIDIPALKKVNEEQQPVNTFFNQEDLNKQLNNNNTLNTGVASTVQNVNPTPNTPQVNSNIQAVEPNESFSLESKSIGTVKKDKQKSPVAMLILFGVLILTIFFIPEITPYFNDVLAKLNISNNEEIYENPNPPVDPDEEEEEIPEENPEPEIETYPIDSTTIAKLDKLDFTNFEKVTADNLYYFNYTINNTDTENSFDFKTNRIYIDFYQDNTYLGRALINLDSLGASSNISLQSVVSESIYTNANSLQIVNRSISDYPKSELNGTIINCEAPGRTLSYTFKDNKLTSIKDIYNYVKVDDNSFTINYLNYQTKALKLSEEEIASAKVTGIEGGFTFEADITYSTDKDSTDNDLTSYDVLYYPKDTTKDVINYEIESLGYTCK